MPLGLDQDTLALLSKLLSIREVFDWTSEDKTSNFSIDVTRLNSMILAGQISCQKITAVVDDNFVRNHLFAREPNAKTVSMVMDDKLRLDVPVLGLWYGPSIILADGTHRYIARWLRHLPTIDYILVEDPLWRQFLLSSTNLPEPTSPGPLQEVEVDFDLSKGL